MDHQMEKKMETAMETEILQGLIKWIKQILHVPKYLYLGNYGLVVDEGHAQLLIKLTVGLKPNRL